MGPGALIASAIAHCVLVASGAFLLSSRASQAPLESDVEVLLEAAPTPGVGAAAPDARFTKVSEPVRDPEAPRVPAGGELHARPDVGAPGRGGTRDGQRATNLASTVAPLTLERDLPNALSRSELSRLRTARQRRSWDDRRATPNPMELDFVASGRGRDALRRPLALASPNQGSERGAVPSLVGARPGAAEEAGFEGPRGAAAAGAEFAPAAGLPRVARGPSSHISAQVLTARPWLPATRAAVPAQQQSQPRDTVDSRQRIASRVASLLDASSYGGPSTAGFGGEPAPTPPAVGNGDAVGARSQPSGGSGLAGDPDDPSFDYYRSLIARVQRALSGTFPGWAILEGRGGLVVFDLALFEDGRVASVSLVRPSGVDEYDRNVVHVVRGMPPFGRVPPALGPSAVIRISYDSRNPAVGRSGPGPGRVSN
jgi:TonB family protein